MDDVGSDCGRQLIDEQPAGLFRVFERRYQSARQIGENTIRMGSDGVQRRYCREVGFLGDQGKRVGRDLEEKEIEGGREVGLIGLTETANVDGVRFEDMRCRMVLMKDTAGMAWNRGDTDHKAAITWQRGYLLQEGFP